MSTFAITGLPHSGTVWLSKELDKSDKFKVIHETPLDRRTWKGKNFCDQANKRFEGKQNYGEVSPLLRRAIRHLNVDNKAWIIRNPYKVILSSINRDKSRCTKKYFDRLIKTFNYDLKELESVKHRGIIKAFKLEDLITNKESLQNIIDHVGVDIKAEDVDLSPRNKSKSKHWTEIEDLPEDRISDISPLDWFLKKYYPDVERSESIIKRKRRQIRRT